jgi:hypothetical protein
VQKVHAPLCLEYDQKETRLKNFPAQNRALNHCLNEPQFAHIAGHVKALNTQGVDFQVD